MKKVMMFVCGVIGLGTSVMAAEEPAKEASPSVYVSAPLFTAYNWRGQVLDDKPVFQPYVFATHNGFNFTTWGSLSTSDKTMGDHDVSEIDLWLSYTLPVKVLEIWVGTINYLPTRTNAAPFHEAFLWVKYPNDIVTPRIEIYQTYDSNVGCYILAGLNREFPVIDKLTLTADAVTGVGNSKWNEYSYGVSGTRLNDTSLNLGLRYTVTDALSITPAVKYVWLSDSKIKDGAKETYPAAKNDPDMFVGSLTLDWSF